MRTTSPANAAPPPRRLHVIFVIGTMHTGGAERQVVEILKRLDRTRFQPALYLDHRVGELLAELPDDVPVAAFWDGPQRHGLLLRWLEFLRLTPVARMIHLTAFLGRTRPDVVYDRTFMATMLTALPTWWLGLPRVSCVVVDPESELRACLPRGLAVGRRMAQRAYAKAAYVVCNAGQLPERLRAFAGLPAERVVVVPNIIDLQRLTATPPLPRNPDGVTEIITVGRLHPQKGQRYLLAALDELIHQQGRRVRLTIIGRGSAEAELRTLAVQRGVSDQVQFAGFVPNPAPLVAAADLFVLPSLYEGLPNALIEAVACGVPVIAADCPTGPREVLDDGRLGTLVPPGDAHSLAEAIAQFLDNPQPFRERIPAARDFVLSRYDATTSIRRLEEVLEQAAAARRAC
jgi:glycosyltransferase involved in cell wall biosynthesis